jgi:HNH endonuclease
MIPYLPVHDAIYVHPEMKYKEIGEPYKNCNEYEFVVEHINGDTLDNRCENLRVVNVV